MWWISFVQEISAQSQAVMQEIFVPRVAVVEAQGFRRKDAGHLNCICVRQCNVNANAKLTNYWFYEQLREDVIRCFTPGKFKVQEGDPGCMFAIAAGIMSSVFKVDGATVDVM